MKVLTLSSPGQKIDLAHNRKAVGHRAELTLHVVEMCSAHQEKIILVLARNLPHHSCLRSQIVHVNCRVQNTETQSCYCQHNPDRIKSCPVLGSVWPSYR